jgi:hypothetical protein
VAAKYNQSVGKPPIDGTKVGVDPRANDIADAYDKLKHDPNDPKVRQSYDALVKETKDQWKALQDAGYKLEVVDQDPYANYEDMAKDIRDNKEIKVFSGGQPPADHPLSQIDPETGVSNNTLFRAVHDIMGHVAGDNDFSQRGEENAYQRHAQSYSDEALPALTTETKGQTSHYFNNSRVREGGTPDFVDQRAALLPEEFHGKQPEPEPLRVNHWSSVPGITETDPEKFGTGVRGAERNRANEPGFLKRTNFGKEGYKEPAVQSKPYKYTADLDPSKYYDAAADPEGIWQKGFAEGGATGAERAVRDAGYHGYHSGTEVASFEKVPVRPADKVIEGQIANQLTQTYSSPSEGVHQVLTEGPNGTNRGYLFAKDVDGNPDAVRIASHGVEEASRGQGIGPSQIENLAWNLNRAGKTTLLSDLQMTDDAKRAWDKVQAKFPDAVTKTPSGYIFDLNKLTPGAKVKPQTLQRRYSGH